MHELAAHPDAARLFGLFNAHSATARGGTMFEPWPTTGVPLAIRDDWHTVLDRAVADGRRPDDALWFGPGTLPAPAELAARHGEATGPGVHPGPESARYLWLDRAQRQARKRGSPMR
jgi:hypothetical protein